MDLSKPTIGSNNPKTPVEREEQRRRRIRRLVYLALLAVPGIALPLWFSWSHPADRTVEHEDIVEHFKYGSIGSDRDNGIPLEVFRVLPRMFPQYLPAGYSGPRDYRAFGLVYEDGKELPIGFSVRRRYIDLVGMNCSACHVGVWRLAEDAQPSHHLAAASNTFDILGYFEFLFQCASDPRFTSDAILAEVAKDRDPALVSELLIRRAIPQLRASLLQRRVALDYVFAPDYPRWGPGSVDTFNPYKFLQFAPWYPQGVLARELYGTADFPVVWNQAEKVGMHLHWDGNNDDVRERNISAAFGAGATPESIDIPAIERVVQWLFELPPPRFIAAIDRQAAARGRAIFAAYCHDCHGFGGSRVGTVIPIDEIGTDRGRLDSFTETLVHAQRQYTAGYPWAFTHFKKTHGYASMPLDGVWARAPYLHNGSVPTMWDLLAPAPERPVRFYRGHGVYDVDKLGIRSDVPAVDGRPSFLHDTTRLSKGNQGHTGRAYGTELPDADKWDLIEYLKTL